MLNIKENGTLLRANIKKLLNKSIQDLTTPRGQTTYFKQIPLQDLFDILKKRNVIVVQEDNTPWSGFVSGSKGRADFDLAFKVGSEYVPITNCFLILSWYRMQSGNYEINAYIS